MSYFDEDVATNYVCAVDTSSDGHHSDSRQAGRPAGRAGGRGPPGAHLLVRPGILDCGDE